MKSGVVLDETQERYVVHLAAPVAQKHLPNAVDAGSMTIAHREEGTRGNVILQTNVARTSRGRADFGARQHGSAPYTHFATTLVGGHFLTHMMVDAARGHARKAVYFDLETTGVGPDAKITCGATANSDGTVDVWHGPGGQTMPQTVAQDLATALLAADDVYTFNGAAFDLRLLYELSQVSALRALANSHRDIMVDFWADNRYFTSMESLATPSLGTGKSNNGAWAATAWFDGEHEAVLEYCKRDVEVLRELVERAQRLGKLSRTSKAGRTSTWVLPSLNGSVRTVAEAFANVAPTPRWMSKAPGPGPDLGWTTRTPPPGSEHTL